MLVSCRTSMPHPRSQSRATASEGSHWRGGTLRCSALLVSSCDAWGLAQDSYRSRVDTCVVRWCTFYIIVGKSRHEGWMSAHRRIVRFCGTMLGAYTCTVLLYSIFVSSAGVAFVPVHRLARAWALLVHVIHPVCYTIVCFRARCIAAESLRVRQITHSGALGV